MNTFVSLLIVAVWHLSHAVNLSEDYTMTSVFDDSTDEFTITASITGDTWLGLGFATSASMSSGGTGTEVYVCSGTPASVTRHWVTGYAVPGGEDVPGATCSYVDGKKTMVFTRTAAGPGGDIESRPITPGTNQWLIWAKGNSNTLGYHGQTKGSLEYDFATPPVQSSGLVTLATGYTMDTAYNAATQGYDFTLDKDGNTWMGVGITTAQNTMDGLGMGTDMVICSEGQVLRYWVTGNYKPFNGVNVTNGTCSYNSATDKTTMTFSRTASTMGTERAIASQDQWVNFAWGENGQTAMSWHAERRGSTQYNFGGADGAQTSIPETVEYTGILIDIYCWEQPGTKALDGAVLDTNPEDHTVHCLQIEVCIDGGYALLEKPAGSDKYVLKYKLDAAGNQKALAIINKTPTVKNFQVKVTGVVTGDVLAVDTIEEVFVDGSDKDKDGPISLGSKMQFEAKLDASKENMEFTVELTDNAWVGIGLSETGQMVNSDTVICSDGVVTRHWITARTQGNVENSGQDLAGATCTQESGKTTMTFSRPIAATGAEQIEIVPGVDHSVIYAHGGAGQTKLQYHDTRGSINFDFQGRSSGPSAKSASALLYLHIICMIFGWGLLLPLGAVIANTMKKTMGGPKGAWFMLHRKCQSLGLLLMLTGFVMIVIFTEVHFLHTHTIIGLVVTIAGVLQPLNAFVRPHVPGGGWDSGSKPIIRTIWEIVHKGIGWGAIIMAIVNIILGVILLKDLEYDQTVIATAVVLAVIGLLTVVIVGVLNIMSPYNALAKLLVTSQRPSSDNEQIQTPVRVLTPPDDEMSQK